MRFKDKICVVTGGANGIGRCIAEAFAFEGAHVAIIDTDAKAKDRLGEKLRERLLFFEGDVSDKQTLEQFAQKVKGTFGHVDCLINNACLSRKGLLSGCSYEDFEAVLRVGVSAPYYLALLFLDSFAMGSSIINIASTRAVMSQSDTESYTAAKGGISALTHALSISLSGRVRVNTISPGWIDTGAYQHSESYTPQHQKQDHLQHPAGRIGQPFDIAAMALFLCSDQAGFINGENITVDGGMTHRMIYHGDEGWNFQISD